MDTDATVVRALAHIQPGRYVTVDHLRDELDTAMLTSAEKSGGLRAACSGGYITGVFLSLPGFDINYPVHAAVPSTHPAGKGRYVKLWRRTSKPVVANVVGSQGNSRYDGGSKAAPGVASTNTESLALIRHNGRRT